MKKMNLNEYTYLSIILTLIILKRVAQILLLHKTFFLQWIDSMTHSLSILFSIVLYKAYYLPRPKRQYVRSLVTSLEIVFGNLSLLQ